MYREDSFGDAGAFDTVTDLGKQLLADPPAALLVVSAHWQQDYARSSNGLADVGITSTDGDNSLIYDFYGFDKHMYSEQFHSRGSKELSRRIAEKITTSADGKPAFNSKLYGKRGFDHGLWVPMRVALPEFSVKNNKTYVPFPVIQMSLPSSSSGMRSRSALHIAEETKSSYQLGSVLRELRDRHGENIAIVCSGMSVHNLRDMWTYSGKVAPYASKFDSALTKVVEDKNLEGRVDKLTELFQTPITFEAHPTIEHIMPIAVALGASSKFDLSSDDDSKGKRLYTNYTSSLAWGIFQFGQ